MKTRDLSQDIVKGLAILVVVQLHSLRLNKTLFYLLFALFGFIMPVFMFLSGYNYHPKQISPVVMMKKRVGTILKIYFSWVFLVLIVMGPYFYFHKDGTVVEILRSFGAHLLSESGCKMLGLDIPLAMFQRVLGPCWFIQYLVSASIIFYLCADHALKSLKQTFSVSTPLILMTFVFLCFRIYLPWGFQCAPALAGIMIIATSLAKSNQFTAPESRPYWTFINAFVCLLIVDAIQIFFPAAGIMGSGLLGEVAGPVEVFFLICFAVFGTYFLLKLAKPIEKIPYVSKGLIWSGQHSLEILLLHRPIGYLIRDAMHLPHFANDGTFFTDRVTMVNLIAFLLIFVFMIPMIILYDRYKAKRKAGAV